MFEIKVGSRAVSDGAARLALQLYNHLNYRKGDENKKKRGPRNLNNIVNEDPDGEEAVDDVLPLPFNKGAADYACAEYEPPLSEEESCDSQEEKRLRLLNLADLSSEEASILVEQTYPSLRVALNRARPLSSRLPLVLEQYPSLLTRRHFLSHANRLLGKSVLDTWNDNISKRCGQFNDFMSRYWAREDSRRSTPVSRQMLSTIDSKIEACATMRNQMANSLAMFPLLMGYMKEDHDIAYQILPVSKECSSFLWFQVNKFQELCVFVSRVLLQRWRC